MVTWAHCRTWAWAILLVGLMVGISHGGPPTVEEVLKVWKAREEKVRTARFEWERKEVVAQGFYTRTLGKVISDDKQHPPRETTLIGNSQVSFSDGTFRYEYQGTSWSLKNHEVRPSHTLSTFDGKIYKHLVYAAGADTYPNANIQNSAKSSAFNDLCLQPIWLSVRGDQSVSQNFPLHLYEPTGQIVTIGSRRCYEYMKKETQHRSQSLAYFDSERDYQLVRKVDSRSNAVLVKVDVIYAPHSELGWLPKTWEYVTKDLKGRLGITVSCKLQSVVLNPKLRTNEFDAEIPPKTYVTDQTGSEVHKYVVQSDGSPGRSVPITDRNTKYNDLVSSSKQATPLLWVVVWVSLCAVAIIAGALVCRRLNMAKAI